MKLEELRDRCQKEFPSIDWRTETEDGVTSFFGGVGLFEFEFEFSGGKAFFTFRDAGEEEGGEITSDRDLDAAFKTIARFTDGSYLSNLAGGLQC